MAFFKRTIKDVPIDHKTVLVRADYNVPLNKKGEISDDLRIRASIPTLEYLLKHHAKVVVMSHLGRPEGRDKSQSLEVVSERLAELLGKKVIFVDDCIGDKVVQAVKKAPADSVVLLENLRYYAEEEANDEKFAEKIAKSTGARYFVQDGFGVVHRAHASTDAITHFVPGVSGLLLEREYVTITSAMEHPKRPLVAVMGGAKISDKITVIERLVGVADRIVIGGAMANTFLKYKGYHVGASKVEDGKESVLDGIYSAAHDKSEGHADDFIMLPADLAVAKEVSEAASRRNIGLGEVAEDDIILDIGDQAIENMVNAVSGAKTVIWNGTLGYAELPEFAHGSARLALQLATDPEITSIIGGGDTADFVLKWDGNGGESFTHVSTGGGASLELMAGKKLPGVESLLDS
ncbi:phosphoglycerate kinase [Candidatus Saccharibacteria bacterium 49-20]|nr:MAG: phosphoglycerate kinase [Candidatus Saccharibacteria bacterium 49-20]